MTTNKMKKVKLVRKQIIEVNRRRFQLMKKLGEGGTGSVWLAQNLESSRGSSYAMKVLYLDVNDMTTESAKREIEVLSKLDSPHIIKLLDAERKQYVDGHPAAVLIMECAPRGDLFEYIRFNKGLRKGTDSSAVHYIFKNMVSALEHMHGKGIAHRDIKPENILFDYHYEPRLADMGFSKPFLNEKNQTLRLREKLGSRGYHAPEIVRDRYYTESVDIFSLGVVLFIMYSGSPPFKSVKKNDWWYEKLAKRKYKQFWQAHERGMRFSSALKRLLEGMLCTDPKKRITLEEIKKSVWYNKTSRMSDDDYRHYMHSIYKQIHPKCKSQTPGPKKEKVVEKQVESEDARLPTVRDTPPAVKAIEVEDIEPPQEDNLGPCTPKAEVLDPNLHLPLCTSSLPNTEALTTSTTKATSPVPNSSSNSSVNPKGESTRIGSGAIEANIIEDLPEPIIDDDIAMSKQVELLPPTIIPDTLEAGGILEKADTLRDTLRQLDEDMLSMKLEENKSQPAEHNILPSIDAESDIPASTPLANTPLLTIADVQHPFAQLSEESSSESTCIQQVLQKATPEFKETTATVSCISNMQPKTIARDSKRRRWFGIF